MSQRYNHYNRYNHNNYYKEQKHNQNNYQQQSNSQVEYQQHNQVAESIQVAEQSESVEQQTKNKHVMLSIIGVAILVIGLVGITYAFFNYTRTGTANVIKTGNVSFSSEQGPAINLTNMFPIDVSEGIPNDATKVGTVTIHVTGDTNYNTGVEYLVSAVNVSNTVGTGANQKSLPISIDVSYTANGTGKTVGVEDNNYFSNRGVSATTSIYHVYAKDNIDSDGELIVGYIKAGETGIDGNIVIKAFIDNDLVAISDTYDENNPGTDNMGTTTEWVSGRRVFTTTEWNSLQQNGVSFQIKVEANEGIWVEEPPMPLPSTIASCPNCVFVSPSTAYYLQDGYDGAEYHDASTTDEMINNGDTIYTNYNDLIAATGKKAFLGLVINENTHEVERAYMCGIFKESDPDLIGNNGTPFCVEGTQDGSSYNANSTLLNSQELWNGKCEYSEYQGMNTVCGSEDNYSTNVTVDDGGYAHVYSAETSNSCTFYIDGEFSC